MNARTRVTFNDFGIPRGLTALHFAVGVCRDSGEIIKLLLRSGADPNASTSAGLTALMTGAALANASGVSALLSRAGDKLKLELGLKLNGSTALSLACYSSSSDVVRSLIKAGASAISVTHAGGNRITSA